MNPTSHAHQASHYHCNKVFKKFLDISVAERLQKASEAKHWNLLQPRMVQLILKHRELLGIYILLQPLFSHCLPKGSENRSLSLRSSRLGWRNPSTLTAHACPRWFPIPVSETSHWSKHCTTFWRVLHPRARYKPIFSRMRPPSDIDAFNPFPES